MSQPYADYRLWGVRRHRRDQACAELPVAGLLGEGARALVDPPGRTRPAEALLRLFGVDRSFKLKGVRWNIILN